MKRHSAIVPLLAVPALFTLTTCGRDTPADPAATAPPVIRSITPSDWAMVSGSGTIEVDAPEAATVVVLVDDRALQTLGPPFRMTWDSAALPNGAHVVTVTAVNSKGSADSTIVLVSNNPGRGVAVIPLEREVRLSLGDSRQFNAIVIGTNNQAVTWSIQLTPHFPGALGTISPDGLYRTPARAPIPPRVTLVARSVADPAKSAFIVVHLDTPPRPSKMRSGRPRP